MGPHHTWVSDNPIAANKIAQHAIIPHLFLRGTFRNTGKFILRQYEPTNNAPIKTIAAIMNGKTVALSRKTA